MRRNPMTRVSFPAPFALGRACQLSTQNSPSRLSAYSCIRYYAGLRKVAGVSIPKSVCSRRADLKKQKRH